jgi:hypothetical protein
LTGGEGRVAGAEEEDALLALDDLGAIYHVREEARDELSVRNLF